MSVPLLSAQKLSHRYRHSAEPVLRDVAFDVVAGEAVALVGRSGCGKSTLLHLIAGLTQPTAGAVHIHGEPVRKPSARWVVMFQHPLLYPWMTAFENAALGPRFAGRLREAPKRVGDLLALVNMADHADTNVQRLSAGQQQRIALARSLAALGETTPALLVAHAKGFYKDEGLDVEEPQLLRGWSPVLAPPDMPPALAAKKIHAYIVAEPFNAVGELKAGGKILRFTGTSGRTTPAASSACTRPTPRNAPNGRKPC